MSSILFEVRDSIAIITLNRPEKRNALNRALALELQEKLNECRQPAIRCVYLTGAGTAFCSGQDLEEAMAADVSKVHMVLNEQLNPIVKKIRKLEKPVVAAVNGVAAGAGANVALACDIVVAAQSASFVQAFTKIGLIPDTGGTYVLPRLVGMQRAKALAMLGVPVSSEEAERMGMIYKVFADEVFAEESLKLAQALAQMPTVALALTKRAMHQSFISSFDDQLHDEELLQQQAARTQDSKEGIMAFLEKRKPDFKGR